MTEDKSQERKRPYKPRKSGAGRKPLKPDYDAAVILQEQMKAAVALYANHSLQAIAEELSLNPIKVRKLLITAGVYESEIADAISSLDKSVTATLSVHDSLNISANFSAASAVLP